MVFLGDFHTASLVIFCPILPQRSPLGAAECAQRVGDGTCQVTRGSQFHRWSRKKLNQNRWDTIGITIGIAIGITIGIIGMTMKITIPFT